MKTDKLSNRQYEILALHATYDFNLEEGKDAGRLLCEIGPNIDNISKLKGKTIDSRMLASEITKKLLSIITSKTFQSTLRDYADDEINAINKINDKK